MTDHLQNMLGAINQSINKTFLERCRYEEPALAWRAANELHKYERDCVVKLLVDRESLKLPTVFLPIGHPLP